MAAQLSFQMGLFEAKFPTDRLYAKNHMWASQKNEVFRFGFSAYAVRLLQDVYFLDWSLESESQVQESQAMGSIESKKAESDLYVPISGRLVQLNDELLSDPSAINVDIYGEGWLFEIEGKGDSLLTPQEYLEHLNLVWEVAQKTIKGQLNN